MDPTVAAIIWWGVGFWCGLLVACVMLRKLLWKMERG